MGIKTFDFEELVQLYYYPNDNLFVSDGGFAVFNIFTLITPNDLYLFTHNKEYMLVQSRSDRHLGVELFWPDDDEMEYIDNCCSLKGEKQ